MNGSIRHQTESLYRCHLNRSHSRCLGYVVRSAELNSNLKHLRAEVQLLSKRKMFCNFRHLSGMVGGILIWLNGLNRMFVKLEYFVWILSTVFENHLHFWLVWSIQAETSQLLMDVNYFTENQFTYWLSLCVSPQFVEEESWREMISEIWYIHSHQSLTQPPRCSISGKESVSGHPWHQYIYNNF